MIDHNTISRIFDTADIVEVISEFVTLKKSGANYKGLSPFSNEKTPSFMVSPSKGIFKDFSSGKGGNVVGFLMEHEKLSYPEALRYLAKKYNIEIEEKEKTAEDIQQENERESLLVVTSFAQKYFTDTLHKSAEGKAIGLKYLKERGVREDIIDRFELGYSPEERNALSMEAQKKGYKSEYMVKSGLSIEREGRYFDRFAGRVIFPIHSLSGTVIGFGGRTLRSDKKTAKYLNSPESEIYHKSRVLYGLFQAKKAIVSSEKCYLVEGYTDVLAFHQAGIENVVSSSGTALTVEQIRLIKRFTPNITIIYDGDEAGIKASFRGIDLILEEGLNLKVILLPDGEDPDSFSKKNSSSELTEFIEKHERDFISFKTSLLLKEAEKDPVKKANLITDIVRTISVIPETISRSVYIKECSTLLKIDEKVLYSEVNKNRRKKFDQKFRSRPQTRPEPDFTDIPTQPPVPSFVEEVYSEYEEREIIYFLLKFGEEKLRFPGEDNAELSVAEYIIREIQNENLEFKNLVYKKVFEDVLNLLEKGQKIEEKFFVYHEDKTIQELAVDIYTSRYELSKIWMRKDTHIEVPGENLGSDIPKSILSYKNKIITNAIEEIEKSITDLYGDDDKYEEIRQLQQRHKKLKQLNVVISKDLGERIINY